MKKLKLLILLLGVINVLYAAEGDTIIVDNNNANNVLIGTWYTSTNTSGFVGANYHQDGNTDKGNKFFIYKPQIIKSGFYDLYLNYFTKTYNFPVDIVHNGDTTHANLDYTKLDAAPAIGYQYIGSYYFDKDSIAEVIVKTNGTTDYVIVDALKMFFRHNTIPVKHEFYLRNEDLSYITYTGSWTATFGIHQVTTANAGAGTYATMILPNTLHRNGIYKVSFYVSNGTDRATNAPFTFITGNSASDTLSTIFTMDESGNSFMPAATDTVNADTVVAILKSQGINGKIIIQRVKFEMVGYKYLMPPLNLNVTALSEDSINISWAASSSQKVAGYLIYQNGVKIDSVDQNTLTYGYKGLLPNSAYTLAIQTVDSLMNYSVLTYQTVVTPDITAPTKPIITVVDTNAHSIEISWTASADNDGVLRYDVYKNTSLIESINGLSYIYTSLTDLTAYQLYVIAVDSSDNMMSSDTIIISTLDSIVPTKPVISIIDTNARSIAINWTASADNDGVLRYDVYKNTSLIESVNGLSYIYSGLTDLTAYQLYVIAVDSSENMMSSDTISITTLDSIAPTKPSLDSSDISTTSLKLTWTASTDNDGVLGYYVYQDDVEIAGPIDSINLIVTGLTSNTTYNYYVVSIDSSLNRTYSDTISATTLIAVGVSSLTQDLTISAYPNPVKDILYINANNIDIENVMVFDLLGNVVWNSNNSDAEIDCSKWATGTYFIELIGNEKREIIKIIKK